MSVQLWISETRGRTVHDVSGAQTGDTVPTTTYKIPCRLLAKVNRGEIVRIFINFGNEILAMRQSSHSLRPKACRISFYFSFAAILTLLISTLCSKMTSASSGRDNRESSRQGTYPYERDSSKARFTRPYGDSSLPTDQFQGDPLLYDEREDNDVTFRRRSRHDNERWKEPPPLAPAYASEPRDERPYGGIPRLNQHSPARLPLHEKRGDGNHLFRRWPRDDDDKRPELPPSEPFLSGRGDMRPEQQQRWRRQSQASGVGASYNPIHYEFQESSTNTKGRQRASRQQYGGNYDDVEDNMPQTFLDQPGQRSAWINPDRGQRYASPRRDTVTRYMSSSKGRMALIISSSTVGASIGAFVGKSFLNQPKIFAKIFSALFFIATMLRNPYGELSRALGMALILSLQRSRLVRRRYPTWPHIKASIGAASRRPFPPSESPWAYRPEGPRDVEFRMLYSVIAMGLVGSTCGGNINLPLVPTWIGGISGAGLFAFATSIKSAQGDLARTMGMRVVSLGKEILAINDELQIIGKLGLVSGRVVDKLLFLDRKHRIKDRLVASMTWVYERLSRTVSQVQNEMQDEAPRT